jgi:drug/metabolite transporter (DMT)-like permease
MEREIIMSKLTKGYTTAIIGIVMWSTTGVFISYIVTTYHMPALLLAFWRNLLVCAALIPIFFLFRRPLLRLSRPQTRLYIFYGFILAIFNSIWVLSVQENGAAVATVLVYSSAGFTAILAFWLFKEKSGFLKIAAIILSLAGCIMVADAYNPDMWRLKPLGISTGLLSGVLFAGYTLYGKEAAQRKINAWTSLLYSFGIGSLFLLLFNLIPILPGAAGSLQALWPDLPTDGWLVLLFLSFVPTLLGFGLYNASMNYLPASIANLLATTEPALTAVEAYVFLDERMTSVQIAGSVIILLAVFIVRLEKD